MRYYYSISDDIFQNSHVYKNTLLESQTEKIIFIIENVINHISRLCSCHFNYDNSDEDLKRSDDTLNPSLITMHIDFDSSTSSSFPVNFTPTLIRTIFFVLQRESIKSVLFDIFILFSTKVDTEYS